MAMCDPKKGTAKNMFGTAVLDFISLAFSFVGLTIKVNRPSMKLD